MPDFMPHEHHLVSSSLCLSVPYIRVVFMNMQLTYEDVMVMSWSGSKQFGYTADVNHILNAYTKNLHNVGSIVQPFEYNWWQCHFDGAVFII